MKVLLFFLITFALNVTYANTLQETDLIVKKGPSVKQVETAIKILEEAIKAKKNSNNERYLSKLRRALKFQDYTFGKKNFKSAFVAKYRGMQINYFSERVRAHSPIRFDVLVTETCFNGSARDAISLLKEAIKQNMIGSDENWYANPLVDGKNIKIEVVDGPNEMRDWEQINSCK